MAKFVRFILTPFRIGGLLPSLGVTGETQVADTIDRKKAAVARKNARPMAINRFFEVVSKRYPKIIARLAE